MSTVVARDVAEAEFDRFLEDMDILVDESTLSEEELNSFRGQRERIIQAITKGHLVINDRGEPVYTPYRTENVEPLTFHERTGASIMAMDGKKKNEDVKKMYAVMGDLCKVHPNTFAKLRGADIKTCEAIFVLLMG